MNEIYIKNLAAEFSRFSYPDILKKYKSTQYLYLFAYYHYFDGDSSKIDEIIKGDLTYSVDSDNIDGIYIDTDSDEERINIIITILNHTGLDFIGYFDKAEKSYFEALEGKGRTNLLEKVKDSEYRANETKPISFIIVTDYVPNAKEKTSIQRNLSHKKSEKSFVDYRIIFGNDLENEILEIEDPKEYVESANLKIDNRDNLLRYGNEKSIIANISAQSLKELYQSHSYRGLFAQNLRYYIKNAKIDDSIVTSIQNRKDDFWYLNNGIIIVCDDFELHYNELCLKNFSIINGGQTTYLIGETDFADDFYLQCKIIKINKTSNEDRINFIADIAEASNTQKPIKTKDLIANRKEQRLLKTQLASANVFCAIKRGQKVNKKIYTEPYQNTNNEEIGQFILSFMYQQPGYARNNKASLTSNEDRYTLIFKKQYSNDTFTDLLKFKTYYKLWVKSISKKADEPVENEKIGLISNGMFFMISIIGILEKIICHSSYLTLIKEQKTNDEKRDILSQYDISHRFINESLNLSKEAWFKLFDVCYNCIYLKGYEYLKSFKPRYTGYSNFTKVQQNYSIYILNNFIYQIVQYGLPNDVKDVMKTILYHPTDLERQNDEELLNIYVNYSSASINSSALNDIVILNLKEALQNYRTNQYKKLHIKAYEIYTNKTMNKIATYGPDTIEDLENLKVLDRNQLNLFGKDIIEIVQKEKNKQR